MVGQDIKGDGVAPSPAPDQSITEQSQQLEEATISAGTVDIGRALEEHSPAVLPDGSELASDQSLEDILHAFPQAQGSQFTPDLERLTSSGVEALSAQPTIVTAAQLVEAAQEYLEANDTKALGALVDGLGDLTQINEIIEELRPRFPLHPIVSALRGELPVDQPTLQALNELEIRRWELENGQTPIS